MSELERAFIDVAEQTWKKVDASDGRTMHFKDGTPVSENQFNGATANVKYEGEMTKVAIPSDKGPGYERVEVSPIEASALGQELNFMRDDVPGEARETVTIDGVEYNTKELAELNERITDRHGPEAVMKY